MEKKWYALLVLPGCEDDVCLRIKSTLKNSEFASDFDSAVAPSLSPDDVSEKVYPGYAFVKISPKKEVFALISSIDRVGRFVSGRGDVIEPVSDKEMEVVLSEKKSEARVTKTDDFSVGLMVEVVKGPFSSYSGIIEEVYMDKQRLRVIINIFGRTTPIEVGFDQVASVDSDSDDLGFSSK